MHLWIASVYLNFNTFTLKKKMNFPLLNFPTKSTALLLLFINEEIPPAIKTIVKKKWEKFPSSAHDSCYLSSLDEAHGNR